MTEFQREFGRVEAKVEIMQKDVEQIKEDLAEIKEQLVGRKAVSTSDWKRLGLVATLASLATHIFNWLRPFTS